MKNFIFKSYSEDETKKFAKDFASKLNKSDVLVLSGDLGSGKTKFTEGILSYYNLEMPNLDKYDEYQKAVDDIIRVSNSNVRRNGFDHLLWYYHKGRI